MALPNTVRQLGEHSPVVKIPLGNSKWSIVAFGEIVVRRGAPAEVYSDLPPSATNSLNLNVMRFIEEYS